MLNFSFQFDRGPDHKRVVTWLSLVLVTLGYLCGLIGQLGHAQTAVALAPLPQLQFFDQTGLPLAFGCVFTYQTGTTTPQDTYTDSSGLTKNQNPVILSAGGSANIWLIAGQGYSFRLKSSGGSNCSSGSTLYTVNGIGLTGSTVLTTAVPYSASPTFTDAAQNQLFTMTLTGNATSNPMTFVGVTPPGIITFQITQDGSGSHSFSYPSNIVGGATISSTANVTTQQTFLWNGTNATALGPATYEFSPSSTAFGVTNFYDFGLTASSIVCDDANKQLTSSGCGSFYSVNYNGQTVAPGGSGNVNPGTSPHTLAINQGNGNAITGVSLAAHQYAVGEGASADPAAVTVPDCQDSLGKHLNYTQSGDSWTCGTSVPASAAGDYVQSTTLSGCGATCTYNFAHTFTAIHSCVCSGEGGSCNVASKSTSSCTINTTVGTNDVTVSGVY